MLARHFDPARPVVASSSFATGDKTIAAGESFDWRARGMSEVDAAAMFGAGLLVHPPQTATLRLTPGERVTVASPGKRKR